MYKLGLEKEEEPEIKLPTSTESEKMQGSSRKTSTSASSSMLKPLTMWITKNCRKFLKKMAVPDHLTCFLRNLYAGQVATVRTGHETTSWFKIGKGIQGGCILSPCLFNFYTEYIMWNEAQTGFKIARKNINNLMQANNTTLMAEMEKAMATHSSTLAWKTP